LLAGEVGFYARFDVEVIHTFRLPRRWRVKRRTFKVTCALQQRDEVRHMRGYTSDPKLSGIER